MDDWKAILIGLGITVALRVLDYLAPKGHHNKWLSKYAESDRWAKKDDEEVTDEDT